MKVCGPGSEHAIWPKNERAGRVGTVLPSGEPVVGEGLLCPPHGQCAGFSSAPEKLGPVMVRYKFNYIRESSCVSGSSFILIQPFANKIDLHTKNFNIRRLIL